jgi:hypothetical protein
MNHLDPSIKKTRWTYVEDAALCAAQALYGNAWTKIAEMLPGRSENAVKNRWNSACMTRARARLALAKQQPPQQQSTKKGKDEAAPLPAIAPAPPAAAAAAAAAATAAAAAEAVVTAATTSVTITQQPQQVLTQAHAAAAPTPIKRSRQEMEGPAASPSAPMSTPTRMGLARPPQHHLYDHGADMESVSSISSASAVSTEESECESEQEEEEKHEHERQRSQLPPRHRGLQHHQTQHTAAAAVTSLSKAPTTTTITAAATTTFSGLAGLALAASALCSPTPAAPPAILAQQPQQAPSQRMRDVISLLFSAMRGETDSTRRALLQDALDAATQENPAMVNFVEGALGGQSVDLGVEGDRLFLLDQVLAATHRGVFGPRTFRF